MSIKHNLRTSIFAAALLIFASTAAWADAYDVEFVLNTSLIETQCAGDCYLAFQLADGSGTGDANNTVTLSGFALYGGSLDTSNVSLFGGAANPQPGFITLTDSDPTFNAAVQGFIPGSELAFEATFTNNADTGPFPDLFTMSILDPGWNGIPTLDTINDSFITVTLDGTTVPLPNGLPGPPTSFWASDLTQTTYDIPAPGVPEPSTTALLAVCFGFLGLRRKLRAQRF